MPRAFKTNRSQSQPRAEFFLPVTNLDSRLHFYDALKNKVTAKATELPLIHILDRNAFIPREDNKKHDIEL